MRLSTRIYTSIDRRDVREYGFIKGGILEKSLNFREH
jgi:hypothetical protein